MKISERISAVIPAPIDRVNRARLNFEAAGRRILNLGQAVPDYGPPPEAVEHLKIDINDPALHLYTPDPGLPELREALAESLREKFAARATAGRIVISGGANHAFLLAASVLFDSGDAVGLLSPYYLNHQMALTALGLVPLEISPQADFRYDLRELERTAHEHRLKALVLVNPSNPSGKVYDEDELRGIYEMCRRLDLMLIADEVYASFVFEPARMISLLSIDDAADHSIVIGSFSKEYGITGWRVGYLHAPAELEEHLLKAQDYSLICAPRAGQQLALHCLETAPRWTEKHIGQYDARRRMALNILESGGCFEVYRGGGGYFVWFRPLIDIDSESAVFDIMERAGVCLVPGFIFGEQWRGWLRMSFGNQPEEILRTACEKLAEYFS